MGKETEMSYLQSGFIQDSGTTAIVDPRLPTPKTLHQEAHDLVESLDGVRHDLQSLRGEPASLTELDLDNTASLTQIILHCKWLSGEIISQLDLVRQETGRIG